MHMYIQYIYINTKICENVCIIEIIVTRMKTIK